MNLRPGDSFQVIGDGYHLKVVVSFPNAKGDVLIFGLTDAAKISDQFCVFKLGEHPFFNKPDKPLTAVDYRRKLLVPANNKNDHMVKAHARFTAEQVVRIIEGAYSVENMEPYILKELPPKSGTMDDFIANFNKI